jgi:hypothetical protein
MFLPLQPFHNQQPEEGVIIERFNIQVELCLVIAWRLQAPAVASGRVGETPDPAAPILA